MAHHPFNIGQSQMAEAQKIRDREMCGIRSIVCTHNCYLNHKNKSRIRKIKYVNDIIQDLECHGPAGLIHIAILSSIIDRPIRIWNADGNLNNIIGRKKMGYPTDIEYHATDSEGIGHWTLRSGKDPDNTIIDLNSCLFSVIGSQIRQDPLRLRKWTVLKLKNNFQNFAEWIDKIFQSKRNDGVLMIGGAKYDGQGPQDAKKILDDSQGRCAYDHGHYEITNNYTYVCPKGHPRGHASSQDTTIPSVERYSKGRKNVKTGFLSRDDQDYVTHFALKSEEAQKAMIRLNNSSKNQVVKISARDLGPDPLPKMKKWENGKVTSECMDIAHVMLILRHKKCQFLNRLANVMIQTCFPIPWLRYGARTGSTQAT